MCAGNLWFNEGTETMIATRDGGGASGHDMVHVRGVINYCTVVWSNRSTWLNSVLLEALEYPKRDQNWKMESTTDTKVRRMMAAPQRIAP